MSEGESVLGPIDDDDTGGVADGFGGRGGMKASSFCCDIITFESEVIAIPSHMSVLCGQGLRGGASVAKETTPRLAPSKRRRRLGWLCIVLYCIVFIKVTPSAQGWCEWGTQQDTVG